MQFNTYSYLAALLIAVGVFWTLPPGLRRWFVLAISLGFYATWGPALVLVPIALCVGIFVMAQHCVPGSCSRPWFWGAIAYALAFLVLSRFPAVFATATTAVERGFRLDPARTLIQVTVPLGISFYTFEAISYLIDARQGRTKPTRFTDLLLFVMFWPHVIAGPIVRFRELAPQLNFTKEFDLPMLTAGLDRLIWGLVQKNLFADPLSRFVDEGFLPQISRANTGLDNWFLAVAFGLQIYFDFAAYSNMAIGAAKMIGITLPENFRFPYHAKNPSDFWQRWHITLSRWIRDYLFFPVNARFHAKPLPLYGSLLAIMALVGLWHGIGWGFVAWGLLHGFYLVAYRIWEARQPREQGGKPSRVARLVWQAATLAAVFLAWVPFRAVSVGQAVTMIRSMFLTFTPRISFSLNFYLVTLLLVGVCAIEPYLWACISKLDGLAERHAKLSIANLFLLRPALYALGLLLFVSFDSRDVRFIYFQF